MMDRYFAYVPEEVIADQQPEGLRVPIDAFMTPQQDRIYQDLTEDMIAILETGEMIVAPSPMGILLKLRQLLCCPRILDPDLGMGGGFELILERLEDEPHVVIFVPFRLACVFVCDALREKGYDVDILRGGTSPEELMDITEKFRQEKSIIVCTIAYAESFDLETCATSYFLGYDFNIDPNRQAEGRTQRAISEHKFVTWNYIRHRGTVDDVMLMNLNHDMTNVSRVMRRPKEFIAALRGEAYEE